MNSVRRGVCLGWCRRVVTGWYCPQCKKVKDKRDADSRPAERKRVTLPPANGQGGVLLYDRRTYGE